MTNRPTNHDRKAEAKKLATPDFSKYKVCNSYSNPASNNSSYGGEGKENQRISRKHLVELDMSLGERDKKVLSAIQRHRYLMTGQIQRLFFTDAASPNAALRASGRCLKKLRNMGLVDALSRRIGGIRAGSGSLVWYISHAGERLLRLHDYKAAPVRRFFEPSPYFLAHTLAVSEISIQLAELCQKYGFTLNALQLEPECWRVYSRHGTQLSLKPDLYAVTVSGEYEDRWFFEVDLDTESPAKVIEKCRKYHQYYHTGLEQKISGVFPLTIWVVPDQKRKEHLIPHIRTAFEKQPRLFVVITGDELADLIREGGDGGMLC